MANIIQIKRRPGGGAAGAPSALKRAELAYNEVDDILYYGFGDDGSGNATSIKSIAGIGAFIGLTGAQTIAGVKTFSSFPVTPSTPPANDYDVANKKFVVDSVTSGSVADGNKGDVTVGSGGTAWSINSNAVTNAKLATMATASLKGRNTAGTGNVEDLAIATVKTMLALVKGDVGLGNVDNTSDANKPVSSATTTQLNLKAPLASPALTGTPTAPTAAGATNTTQLATTAFVQAAIAALIDSAPGTIDTLNELAAALGDDPNFAATVTTNLALKAPLASPGLTGVPTAPTAVAATNTTQIATTAHVKLAIADATIDGGTF